MTSSRLDNMKTVALALSIIIVLNLFVGFGIKTFYPGPELEDFCPIEKTAQSFTNKESCQAAGGQWFADGGLRPIRASIIEEGQEKPTGWCDAMYTCRKEYREVDDLYSRNVFIVFMVAGLISMGAGWLVSTSTAVSSGLVFGGVLAFIIGTIRYWSGMHDYLRFVILGLTLAILIWIGYAKLNKKK